MPIRKFDVGFKPFEIYFFSRPFLPMNRFFKAYFIASLIYAVWFGVLMYAVDPMFGAMGCDMQSGDYLCFQDGSPRPFTNFLYPFLSVPIFSLLHAAIMKWRKRCSVGMIWFLVGCEWLLLSVWIIAMLARDGFVFSRDAVTVLTGSFFAVLPLLGMALAQTLAIAIASLKSQRKKG